MSARRGPGFVRYRPLFVTIFGRRFGFEYSRVGLGKTPYLDRYIMYLGGLCVRLHKFWRGDDDRAPHDHPWNFWTFPLRSYVETVEEYVGDVTPAVRAVLYGKYEFANDVGGGFVRFRRVVKAWRLHRRPAEYRHIVLGRADGSTKPFWTFVVTGKVINQWGFWPDPGMFVPWRDWR